MGNGSNNSGAAGSRTRSTSWASSGPGSSSGSRPTASGPTCSSCSRACSGRRGWSTRSSAHSSTEPVGLVSPQMRRRRASSPASDSSTHPRSSSSGRAPTRRPASRPFSSRTKVGMPCTPKRAWTAGAWSTLTLMSRMRPAISRASCSRRGLTVRHGPHHGAQRSITIGSRLLATIPSRSVLPASTIHGSGSWHLAQRGTPAASAGTRFFTPHDGQAMVSPTSSCQHASDARLETQGRCGQGRLRGKATTASLVAGDGDGDGEHQFADSGS